MKFAATILFLLLAFVTGAQQQLWLNTTIPAAPPVLPDISGLVFDLDSTVNITNASGAAPAEGDRIKIWKDVTHNQTFQQLHTTAQPIYHTNGAGGLPYLAFSGAFANNEHFTNANGITYSQPNTVFFVLTCFNNGGGTDAQLLDSAPPSGSRAPITYRELASLMELYGGTALQAGNFTTPLNTWFIFAAKYNGASSIMHTNGVQLVAGNSGTSGLIGFTLGGYLDGQSGWGGNIERVLFYNANLSANDMSAVVVYLKARYTIP